MMLLIRVSVSRGVPLWIAEDKDYDANFASSSGRAFNMVRWYSFGVI